MSTNRTLKNKSVLYCTALKNNQNICIKTVSVVVGADATVYVLFLCKIYLCTICVKKLNIYSSIRSSRERLGFMRRVGLFLGLYHLTNPSTVHALHTVENI